SSWSNTGSVLRTFVETGGSFGAIGSIQGGVAIANVSSSSSSVTLNLAGLDGSTQASTSVQIAGNGHAAVFLHDLFPNLPGTFQGILRASTSGAGISVSGLRIRFNERGEFLYTSAPPVNEATAPSAATTLFPHFANGGGFIAEFDLFSASAGQAPSGDLRF